MKIGILSKRTGNFAGKMKSYFESNGHQVSIFTATNLCINDSLMENDFYILKSKHMLYLQIRFLLSQIRVLVIPIRIESNHILLLKKLDF